MQFLSGNLSLLLTRIRTTIHRAHFITVAGGVGFLLAAPALFFISFGGSSGRNVAPPSVSADKKLNASTSPSSPVWLQI